MVRLYLLLFVVQIALAVIALISCLSAEEDEIRGLPRLLWVLVILFFPLVGSIAWFLAGRPATAKSGGGAPEPRRPLAPDDDPEFLGSLDAQQSQQDREMFDKWEEDLQRREDELRRKDNGDEGA
ncbi:PLD nuclease N-terminal domain-containing protein [Phytohabitans rumicis]|uniref:Cardiolipin synthase N-terminal domain-containing protein n=1 Tax=Phytohabitans rumicis TaxID=1076125 RepID=A0A6V8L948_9ACTN|nr:PLD nuclease N-terminal domain-containing protein [Phytohabitans rumicis]GFJ89225.1 hypothetical protein Prum_028670 [Phytohabitans rumicis]